MTPKQADNVDSQTKKFGAKLQAFYDALPEDEKRMMGAILDHAGVTDWDVSGYAGQMEPVDIIKPPPLKIDMTPRPISAAYPPGYGPKKP